MKWTAEDIKIYEKEKEYIDTVIIPLLPITFDSGMKQAAEQGEFIQLLSIYLERQFKGRMLVLPAYSYVDEPTNVYNELNSWQTGARDCGFSYVFYVTADKRWKSIESMNENTLFYVPAIPLEHMDDSSKHAVMEKQLHLLMNDIIQGWQNCE